MSEIDKYFIYNKKLENCISSDAYVVFDTNVLLSAYSWRKMTMSQIKEIMDALKKDNRLKFSLQTIIEFNRHRQKEIKNSLQKIDSEISRINSFTKPIELAPMLEENDVFEELVKKSDALLEAQKSYRDALMKVKGGTENLFFEDDFMTFLKEMVKDNLVREEYSEDYLRITSEEFKERIKEKVPPGYKDSSKDHNSHGDYVIWKDILSLDKDVIFVSNDVKEDWAVTDSNKNLLATNGYLVQEFFEKSNGNHFIFSTPKEFIELWNPDVDQVVLSDVTQQSELFKLDRNDIILKLREANLSYYPGILTEAVFNLGIGKTLELSDDELRPILTKYFLHSIGDIEEYRDNLNLRSTLEEFYDFEKKEVTDEFLRKAKYQALEYANNKLKTDLKS